MASITNIPDLISSPLSNNYEQYSPTIIEYGPISYRQYTSTDYQCTPYPNIKCGLSADGNTQTYYDRPTILFDKKRTDKTLQNQSNWNTIYLTIPNIGYRALETNVVTLANGLAKSFDDVAIPIFSSNLLRTMLPSLDIGLRCLLVPIALQEIVNDAVNTAKIVNSFTITRAYDDVALGFLSNRVNMGILTFGIDLSPNNAFHMSTTVMRTLLNASNPISPLHMDGWNIIFSTIQEYQQQQQNNNMNIGPATQMFMDNFLNEFRLVDTAYPDAQDPTQPSIKALYHINLLLSWLTMFVNTSTTTNTLIIESNAAAALYRIGMIPTNDWKEVIYSQLGSNNILGSIPDLFQLLNASNTKDSRTGLKRENDCPTTVSTYGGASFIDIPFIATQMPAIYPLEFSCWNNREFIPSLPINVSYFTNTSRVIDYSFGSKLSSTDMRKIIHTFTTGPGMLMFYTNDNYFTGTKNIALFLQGIELLQSDLKNFNSTIESYIYSAATGYGNVLDKFWTPNQYNNLISTLGNCPSQYDPLNFQLPCTVLFDIRQWLIQISKYLVWYPQFVYRGPIVYDKPSQTFISHPEAYYANLINENNPLRAGPFIKCTLYEILEYGCHDNLLDYLNQKLRNKLPGDKSSRISPIISTDYSSPSKDNEWNIYKQQHKPNTRYTGKLDIKKIDLLQKFNDDKEITVWNGYMDNTGSFSNTVGGSYTGTQFAPLLSLYSSNNYNYEEITNEISVWVSQGLRNINLQYSNSGMDPYNNLYTWQYRLAVDRTYESWKTTIPRMKTDTKDDTPICAANVANVASGAPVYLSTPYFIGCPHYALANYKEIPGYNYSDNRTRNEERLSTYLNVEPISGIVTNGHKRLGAHLRWDHSVWYPSLSLTYGLVYWIDISGTMKETDSKELSSIINDTRYMLHLLIPAVLYSAGSVFFLLGIYLLNKGRKIPKSLLFTEPHNVPGHKQPKDEIDYMENIHVHDL